MKYLFLGITLPVFATAAMAADAKAPPANTAFQPLLQCSTLTDSAARLSCYDAQVAQLKAAIGSNEVMVVDKAEVQTARRSVFGLALDSMGFLDRDAKGRETQLSEINAKIAAASPDLYGKWHFTLDDGARWTQIEPHDFPHDPKAGMPIRIRKAVGGSFLANVDGQIAVRVERTR